MKQYILIHQHQYGMDVIPFESQADYHDFFVDLPKDHPDCCSNLWALAIAIGIDYEPYREDEFLELCINPEVRLFVDIADVENAKFPEK